MRTCIIGNDGIALCRKVPAKVGDGEIVVASKEELQAAPLNGKRLLALWSALPGVLYSADEPERLRGPQHDAAWVDEIGSWRYPDAWDMLMFGLRIGIDPRVVATTTPRPTQLIRDLVERAQRNTHDVVITRGSSYENRANLAPAFFDQIVRKYEGTRLGRQELEAELLEDVSPSVLRAREWCLQPDSYGPGPDGQEVLLKGVRINARKAVMEGGRQIANLAGRFARDELNRGDESVLSTLATETEFLISTPIARDLETGNWSFAQLKQRPTAVYIILPPHQVHDKRRWTRMLMTAALCEHFAPRPCQNALHHG